MFKNLPKGINNTRWRFVRDRDDLDTSKMSDGEVAWRMLCDELANQYYCKSEGDLTEMSNKIKEFLYGK